MAAGLVIFFKSIGAALLGIAGGFGAVEFYNQMPAKWLTDYGEEPKETLLSRGVPRIKRNPWAYLFSIILVVCYIKVMMFDVKFFICAAFALWLLLEMSICDIKERIVPDQLIILLAISGLGFIPFMNSWTDGVLGIIGGFSLMMAMAFLGKLLYKKVGVGGADIKIMSAVGLIVGFKGVLSIFIMMALIGALQVVYLTVKKRIGKETTIAMVPHVAIAFAIYIGFMWNIWDNISI
ncbi:Prepilin signal peptidase PulO (type II secretory pathway) [Peptostreptococcaceae bacterium pGA-8]|nr:Prepilin signal peptidase PulO (type II secretory pathway) [Peptostreptococcaceae bacterium pGA-8]